MDQARATDTLGGNTQQPAGARRLQRERLAAGRQDTEEAATCKRETAHHGSDVGKVGGEARIEWNVAITGLPWHVPGQQNNSAKNSSRAVSHGVSGAGVGV